MKKEYKPLYDRKLKNLHDQASFLIMQDKTLKNKVLFLENEYKKSKISGKNLKNNNFFHGKNSAVIEPKCINSNSCRVCLEDPNCVWCNVDKKCTLGDQNGPFDGSCIKTFSYSFCEKSCFNYDSCNTCISDSLCGWCGQLDKCIEGNIRKAIGLLCETGYFHKGNQGRCSNHFLNAIYIK